MIRSIALILLLGSAPAMAQSDNTKAPDMKKTEKGFGGLLQGMGQELGKIGGSSSKGEAKKDAAKKPDKND